MGRRDTELMLRGHGLTTAQIYYRMPDHRTLIQQFIWQDYDLAPHFPRLKDFLGFWRKEIEGPLHSVVFCHQRLLKSGEWRNVTGEFHLH